MNIKDQVSIKALEIINILKEDKKLPSLNAFKVALLSHIDFACSPSDITAVQEQLNENGHVDMRVAKPNAFYKKGFTPVKDPCIEGDCNEVTKTKDVELPVKEDDPHPSSAEVFEPISDEEMVRRNVNEIFNLKNGNQLHIYFGYPKDRDTIVNGAAKEWVKVTDESIYNKIKMFKASSNVKMMEKIFSLMSDAGYFK